MRWRRELGFSRFGAWLAATLFALHGSHPEAVVWIAGRFDLLATFFFLVATLAFALSWRATGARRILYECAAAASMMVALLSKESAYSFVLVAALLAVCRGEIRNSNVWRLLLVFAAITAIVFAYRWNLLGGIGGYGGGVTLLPSLKALALRLWAVLFFPVDWAIRPEAALTILTLVYLAALARLFSARAGISRLTLGIGFALLTAAPALSQLLIGVDLEKARVLYLPSIGTCLLLASLCESLRRREQLLVASVLVLFHGTALLHNLRGWEKASQAVQTACLTAAQCARATGQRVVVTGLPRTLDGVYAFANGFQECIEMQTPVTPNAGAGAECIFTWDASTNTLRAAR